MPADDVTVLTTAHAGDGDFDRRQDFRVERHRQKVLLPTPSLVRRIDALADEVGADLVVLDPGLPLGLVGSRLRYPYAVVVHGAEISVPGRLPVLRNALRRVLTGAVHVVVGGDFVRDEAERVVGAPLSTTRVTPGVDVQRFRPLDGAERAAARARFGLPEDARLVVGVGRLVPRKGFDVLVAAAALLAPGRPDLVVAVAGTGRQEGELERRVAETGAPVRLLGRVSDEALPLLHGAADVFAGPCRNRWGGLEQEGFGIVFLEAAAAGVPALAGASGGTVEAVADGETGVVVHRPGDPAAVAASLARLLDDAEERRRLGEGARRRAVGEFDYDVLAAQLQAGLASSLA
ncbi:MAG: glycosyltransferase family 4 protein [Actinomycetota bacterium]|nr:glycosyltransferase family 4 protein [Actinomycetota bacterium]